jgi:hypothetical protein
MPVFMVDRDLPGISMNDLAGAQQAAIAASTDDVRYLRSVWVPGDSHCMCLFEAPDADRVTALNDAAGLPYRRVVEALDLGIPD